MLNEALVAQLEVLSQNTRMPEGTQERHQPGQVTSRPKLGSWTSWNQSSSAIYSNRDVRLFAGVESGGRWRLTLYGTPCKDMIEGKLCQEKQDHHSNFVVITRKFNVTINNIGPNKTRVSNKQNREQLIRFPTHVPTSHLPCACPQFVTGVDDRGGTAATTHAWA
jgi:hypothetical protein